MIYYSRGIIVIIVVRMEFLADKVVTPLSSRHTGCLAMQGCALIKYLSTYVSYNARAYLDRCIHSSLCCRSNYHTLPTCISVRVSIAPYTLLIGHARIMHDACQEPRTCRAIRGFSPIDNVV